MSDLQKCRSDTEPSKRVKSRWNEIPLMPELTPYQWMLAIAASIGVGLSKSGFTGVGMFHVLVFAFLFDPKQSTGVVLPMLIVADILAVCTFKQHARWDYVIKMLPPTCLGVIVGWLLMFKLNEAAYKPVIGSLILALAGVQIARLRKPSWFDHIPHAKWFAWSMGLLSGFSTMLANAAGPIMSLYLVTVALPKLELIGTIAWFFLILNIFKVPFSWSLGLIRTDTLALNVVLVPGIVFGLFIGRWLVHRIPQRLFDGLVLVFSIIAALKLIAEAF